jgi:hypothetical protein
MKTLHLRYTLSATLIAEVLQLFPTWDQSVRELTGIDKHGYFKTEVVDIAGVPTEVYDLYLLVPDNFQLPALMTGAVMLTDHTHEFLGHRKEQ